MSIFSGNPLKNIQDREKTNYLRRYASEQTKRAIDGFFLLRMESAYVAAWEILEDRCRNPFVIANSYRDKLQAWPKIGSKDNFELRMC